MHVIHFEELAKVRLTFIVNLRDIVHTITSSGTTQSGEGTLGLQDERGKFLRVVAMGRHAEGPSLFTPGHEVTLFFGKAQKSTTQNQASTIWFYPDLSVYVIAEGRTLVKVKKETVLSAS